MILIPHFTFKQEVPIISATKEDNNFRECYENGRATII